MAEKWIKEAIKHPGSLRKELIASLAVLFNSSPKANKPNTSCLLVFFNQETLNPSSK